MSIKFGQFCQSPDHAGAFGNDNNTIGTEHRTCFLKRCKIHGDIDFIWQEHRRPRFGVAAPWFVSAVVIHGTYNFGALLLAYSDYSF